MDGDAAPPDPYAGMAWPPPSWNLGLPASDGSAAVPPTIETTPLPSGWNAGDATAQQQADAASVDSSLPPIQAGPDMSSYTANVGAPPPTVAPEGPEPTLPVGALAPDRAPVDAAHGPLDVNEALTDKDRAVGVPAAEDPHQDALNRWKSDPLNELAAKDLTPQDRAALLNAMPPEQRIAYQTQKNDEQQTKNRTEYLDLLHRQETEAQAKLEDFHKAQAATDVQRQKLLADATALANEKTDSNPYWHSLSTGGKLLTALSVIVGGIGLHGNDQNVGIQMFNKSTDDALRAQQEDRQKQRDLLNLRGQTIQQQASQQLEDYHQDTAFRLAANQSMIQALQTEQQNYAPDGTTAQRIAGNVQQYRAQQADLLQKYTATQLKNNLDIAKNTREDFDAQEKARHNKADEAHANWATSIEAKSKAAELVVHPPEYYAANYGTENAPKTPMTEKQFHQYQETLGKISERGTKAAETTVYGAPTVVRQADGQLGFKAQPMVQGDGKTVFKPTPKGAEELRTQFKGTSNVIQDIDSMLALRENAGWTSDISKNADWQRLHSNFADTLPQILKSEGLTRMTEEDVKVLKEVLGNVDDPTRFNGISPGLREARAILTRHYNNALQGEGYDGKAVEWEDTSQNRPPSEDLVNEAARAAQEMSGTEQHGAIVKIGSLAGGGGGGLADRANDVAASQRVAAVTKLREWAGSSDPKIASRAQQALADLSTNANTDEVRAIAGSPTTDTTNTDSGSAPATGTTTISPDEVIGRKKKK